MIFRNKTLRGKKVAVLAADGFEKIELTIPCTALRKAGAKVDVLSLHRGKIRGMNVTEPAGTVGVDRTLADARPDDYDALFIPGGFIGPDFLRQSREAREFVKAFDDDEKPIATLCHGPSVLVSADVVSGRTLASWPGVRDDVVNAGGTWRDEAVVRDGNWVSSRGPQDLKEFVPAMLDLYAGGNSAADLRDERSPDEAHQTRSGDSDQNGGRSSWSSSPRREEPIRAAVVAARVLPRPGLASIFLVGAVVGLGMLAFRRMQSEND